MCLSRWSAAGGGCWSGGPWGRDAAAAVAVAGHGDAGCAGEGDPVGGEYPTLVAEAAAEFFHPEPAALVPGPFADATSLDRDHRHPSVDGQRPASLLHRKARSRSLPTSSSAAR